MMRFNVSTVITFVTWCSSQDSKVHSGKRSSLDEQASGPGQILPGENVMLKSLEKRKGVLANFCDEKALSFGGLLRIFFRLSFKT